MRFVHLAPVAAALVTLTGCSDPVPPTPQGAWAVSLASQPQNPGACQILALNETLGVVNDTKKTQVKPDGADGVRISCEVSGTGPFSVTASGIGNNSLPRLDILIPSITSAATKDKPAAGSAAFSTAQNAALAYTSTSPCNFYFAAEPPEGVSPGKIWVAFNCPAVVSNMSTCAISQGYALFEDCTTISAQ